MKDDFYGLNMTTLNLIFAVLTVVMVGLLFGGKGDRVVEQEKGKADKLAGGSTDNKVEEPKLTLKQLKAQLRREQKERAEKRAQQLEKESPKKAGLL